MGFLGDVGKAIGTVVKTGLDPLGLTTGLTKGLPGKNLITGDKGIGGMLGGGKKPEPPSGGAAGGGGGGSDAMAKAYRAQADAALKAAGISADAAKYSADAQLKAAKFGADAAIQGSKMSAMGGIIGAALGAHTTHEEIKQWLPHEVGAATMMSWDMAEKWNTTRAMKEAGYSPTAIEYALQGKSGKALWSDPQWNAMKMVDMTKRDTLAAAQNFGIQSPSNPYGIAVSEKDWMDLHSYKDPRDILEVDPEVAAQRQQAFADWEKDMRGKGMGMLVDIYKNPQLGGSSILTMKGKDPLLDPALGPMIGTMMQGQANAAGGPPTVNRGKNEAANWQSKFAALNAAHPNKSTAAYKEAHAALLYEKSNSDMNRMDESKAASWNKEMAQKDATNWEQAINALTKGEKNPMTDQINKLMEMGVVDKYGMINSGQLMSHIPPELASAPEMKITRDLSPEQVVQLKDQYNQYASMKLDPKLIREENMGFGVKKLLKLNPDGSIASTAMQGSMYDAMGNEHKVTMEGNRLQEWYDRQSMIGGRGPLFPGMAAPVTSAEMNGRFETGARFNNVTAKPNMGFAGAGGSYGGATERDFANVQSPLSTQATANPYQAASVSDKPANQTTNFGSAPAPTGGKASKVPSGFTGAPLSAGG